MYNKNQWKLLVAGGASALLLTFGVAAVYPQASQAADTTTPAPTQVQRDRQGSDVDHDALLAEALNISTEDLQAAYKEAASAALDQAVKDELLTQKQADSLKSQLDSAQAGGFGGLGLGHMGRFGDSKIDFEALLADALGIKVEALQVAEQKAEQAELDQAVTDGNLTQDQADLMSAQRAFRTYIEKQRPTLEEQLKQAVDAGAITQAQADLLLKNQESAPAFGAGRMGPGMDDRRQGGPGRMGPGMDGGRQGGPGMDGQRGHGGRPGMPFDNNGTQNDQGNQQPDFGAPQSDVAPVAPSAGL